MFRRNRLRPLVTISCLNLCYHLSKIARLARGLRLGRDSQIGRAPLCAYGHDKALAEMLHRLEVTGAVVECDGGGEPAEHLLLAFLGQDAAGAPAYFGKILVML